MQEKKEVKKWQDEEALRRYQMIAPLLDADLDEGKKRQIREKAAEKTAYQKGAYTGMRRSTEAAALKACVLWAAQKRGCRGFRITLARSWNRRCS